MNELLLNKDTSDLSKAIEVWLCERFRRALGRSDFAVTDGFLRCGGDSLTVVETILEIEEEYGVTLSTADFMALDTAENLAQRIVLDMEQGTTGATPPVAKGPTSLSVVQTGDRSTALVCAYGIDGAAPYAITLAGMLPDDLPVAASLIHSTRIEDKDLRTFADTAESDAENILLEYPASSHAVLGYSLGAHVALSVAHGLVARTAPPKLVAIMDDDAELGRRTAEVPKQGQDSAALRHKLKAALGRSAVKPIGTRIVYFRSAENDASYRSDPTSGWGEIATGGVVCVDVPANHGDIGREVGLRHIAPKLVEELSKPFRASPAPSEAQMLRFDARRAAREGAWGREISLLSQVIENDREQPSWVYANLAEAHFDQGDHTAALTALANARAQEKWQLSLDLRFVIKLRKHRLRSQVQEIVDRLATIHSDHPSVHEQKAKIYFRLRLLDECDRELKQGLSMQADHLRLARLQIRHLERRQAWSEMREAAEMSVERLPNVSYFRTALIDGYMRTGAPELALRFRDELAAENNTDAKGLNAFCQALLQCGHTKEALSIADKLIAVSPSSSAAYLRRAEALRALGLDAEANTSDRQAKFLSK